ncbi:YkvA family protein [Candidatus Palauibacter sp.]|uniref:YkvA family protein n=1 Tax=Candidatus Palauibacter sp. TaxID=3101350 RepID=UPI003B0216B6
MRSAYLQGLTEQVAKYAGTLRDVVVLAPVYGMLMFTLMKDPRLGRQQRLLVDAAIAYLVSPDDVIPEDEVGPYGFLDDVFCCAYVAHRIGEELGWDVVEEHWTGERSALEVSNHLLARERELLGGAGDDVLEFAGLLDRRPDSDAERGPLRLTPVG